VLSIGRPTKIGDLELPAYGVIAVTLRYFTEFGKPVFQHRVDLWQNLCTSLLYFVVRVRCRRKESSRSLSHLLMSFLFVIGAVILHRLTKFHPDLIKSGSDVILIFQDFDRQPY